MKSFDFEAVVYDSNVFCNGCLPAGVEVDDDVVCPIFAGSELDYAPVCCECGQVHDYMSIISKDKEDS